jgi:hypothetical protein
MKRWMWISTAPLVVAVTMLANSRAQQAPAAPAEGPSTAPAATRPAGDFRLRLTGERGERGPRDGMRGGMREDHFGDGPPGPPPDGFGGGDGPPPGMRRPPSVDTMRNYLELVDRYAEMSSNPVKAGVGAVITAADLLRAQGNDVAIKYFEDLIADDAHPLQPEIKRAVRLQLAELYKAAGKPDKALENLKAVMQDR